MGDYYLTSEVSSVDLALVIHPLDLAGAILVSEAGNDLIDSEGEFAVEDRWPEVAVDIDVELAEARVNTVNNVLEILVDQHHGRTEDDEVHINGGDAIVEIGFLIHQHKQPLALGEPQAGW